MESVARMSLRSSAREAVRRAILEKHPRLTSSPSRRRSRSRPEESISHQHSRQEETRGWPPYQDLRSINCEVGVLPRAHGSAISSAAKPRLCVATLAADRRSADDRMLTAVANNRSGSFCITTSRRSAWRDWRTGRARAAWRSVTGALAERSLEPVVPSENIFVYASHLREIMESNGSTSMAALCGACSRSWMPVVPVKTPVRRNFPSGLVTEYGEDSDIASATNAYRHHRF